MVSQHVYTCMYIFSALGFIGYLFKYGPLINLGQKNANFCFIYRDVVNMQIDIMYWYEISITVKPVNKDQGKPGAPCIQVMNCE